jgi:hypothetical protein
MSGATVVTGGNNQQQFVKSLMDLLNSVGGPNNIDINALLENPQFIAQLARFIQQQQSQQAGQQQQRQMGSSMHTSNLTRDLGIDSDGASSAGPGLSGANLLNSINNQAPGQSSMSATGSHSNAAFGLAPASALARQQFLNTHSSAVGPINLNNTFASSAAMFDQRNRLGYGLGGGIDMAGGATGTHNLNLSINVGNPGSNGMGVATDLLRRAQLFANQRGISQQDALKALLHLGIQQQNGWNGGGAGG